MYLCKTRERLYAGFMRLYININIYIIYVCIHTHISHTLVYAYCEAWESDKEEQNTQLMCAKRCFENNGVD